MTACETLLWKKIFFIVIRGNFLNNKVVNISFFNTTVCRRFILITNTKMLTIADNSIFAIENDLCIDYFVLIGSKAVLTLFPLNRVLAIQRAI